MQRTRCFYFYDVATPCNKREPGSGCSAINGINRINAILGTSEACIATHPSDMCVALAALEAKVHVVGPAGDRVIPFAEFDRLPATSRSGTRIWNPNEIVTAIELPARGFTANYSYLKIRDRHSYAFALFRSRPLWSSTAARSKRPVWRSAASRTSRGAIRRSKLRCAGSRPDRMGVRRAADLLLRDAKGFEHNAFKIDLARRAIRPHADAGCERYAANSIQQEDPVSVMTLYRHRYLPRGWTRQGHRRGPVRRRVQGSSPGLWQHRHFDHCEGAHCAH